MATLGVVPSPLVHSLARSVAHSPPSRRRKDAATRAPTHPPSSGSRYYALLNQSCHCYCWLRAVSPFPSPFSYDRFLASLTLFSSVSRLPTRRNLLPPPLRERVKELPALLSALQGLPI